MEIWELNLLEENLRQNQTERHTLPEFIKALQSGKQERSITGQRPERPERLDATDQRAGIGE